MRLSAAAPVTRWGGRRFGNRLIDSRSVMVAVSAQEAFAPDPADRRSDAGWYAFDFLWQLRGLIDLLVGGVGLRRGRRDPEQLRVGDALDWWRVEAIEPDRRLRLVAEMKLPGRAWLEFGVETRERRASASARPRRSIRPDSRASPTGTVSIRFMRSCSAACCAESRAPPSND